MIEINLLPQESKVKSKKISAESIQTRYFIYIVPLVLGILVCVHIYLMVIGFTKSYQLRSLDNKWRSLEPQRKILEIFKKESELLSADVKIIQRLTVHKISWAEKLNKLSLNLPIGVWFNELSVDQKDFILKGSVISLQKEELGLINKFIDNLKNDLLFFKSFNNLELNSVQRRTFGGYDIIDFILVGSLKQ